jgi:tRNA(His) 5'-end guanylyltransferase
MKEFYEIRDRRFLTRRTPVIIRIDGKAFHTYTRGLKKPFDDGLMEDMQLTTKYLCENIQGCKFGYVQSDEISLLLTDYDTFDTQGWFDYCQNKMESIAASMATAEFNRLRMLREVNEFINFTPKEFVAGGVHQLQVVLIDEFTPANFDARAFNIPKEEVANYFIWRQQDATKNSISMLAQSLYSHKELQGKNGDQMQEMCFQKGVNWNDIGTSKKRGTSCYKALVKKDLTNIISLNSLQGNPKMWHRNFEGEGPRWGVMVDAWKLDFETPIFTKERTLIENLI